MLITPTLIAHRGYARLYPENSLIGIEAAISAGARFVEIDIQLSRDQIPILLHDQELERITGMSGRVFETSFRQIQTLRAREYSRFGHKFADEPIAGLKDFCELLGRHPEVTAFVELKLASIDHFGVATVLNAVLSEISSLANQCVLISYSTHVLHAARKHGGLRIGAILEKWNERNKRAVRTLQAEFIFCDVDTLPRWGRLHAGDSHIAVFEITDAGVALRLAQRGVEYIETFAFREMRDELELRRAGER